jgi:hypothetical protein
MLKYAQILSHKSLDTVEMKWRASNGFFSEDLQRIFYCHHSINPRYHKSVNHNFLPQNCDFRVGDLRIDKSVLESASATTHL